jgi:hypothetical protein
MIRRIAAALALTAMLVAGCALAQSPSLAPGQVYLLTGTGTCWTDIHGISLVLDPTYGTAETGGTDNMPVAWPPGYTGRQVGSEIEVLNAGGEVVATTGHVVELFGGYTGPDGPGEPASFSRSAKWAFLVCDAARHG